jgi:hypothetical protein
MPDVIIQTLTHWPTPTMAVVITFLAIFKRPLERLIDRLIALKLPGVEISAPKQGEGAGIASSSSPAAIVASVDEPVPKLPDRIFRYDSFLVARITPDLIHAAAAITDRDAREKRLAEIAAEGISAALYENRYANIYGSQLTALSDLNSAGTIDVEALRRYFDGAKAAYPVMYERDTFERWLAWLVDESRFAELHDENKVAISDVGRDFLQFLIAQGRSLVKIG